MKFIGLLLVFGMMAAGVQAQERAAAGAIDTQMTWTTLSNQIQANKVQTEAVNSRVDQVVVCANKGKLYTPGKTGADTEGCSDTGVPANVQTAMTNVTNIIACNKAGQVYDGTKCVDSTSATPPIQLIRTTARQVKTGFFNVTQYIANCPTGYTMISCTGDNAPGMMTDANSCTARSTSYSYHGVTGGSTRTGPGSAGLDTETTYRPAYAVCMKN